MFSEKSILCILAMFFIMSSCSNNTQEANELNVVQKISAQELVEIQKAKSDLLILDVRTSDEISKGKIPSAITEDFYNSSFETNLQKLDNNRPIVVYCKSGGRSGKAAKILEKVGFKEVYDLKDGYKSWTANQ